MSPKTKARAPAAPARASRPKKESKEPEPSALRAALTIDDAAVSLSCSVPTVYRLIGDGHLTSFLIGRKRYVSPWALKECVERLEKLGAVLPDQSGGNNRPGPATGIEAQPQEA